MSMEDEIRQQKEQMRAEEERRRQEELFKQELAANGFNTEWHGSDYPVPVVPHDELKKSLMRQCPICRSMFL